MASKRTSVIRHRISARVMPAFYNKFCAAMKILGLSQQDLIVQSLESEMSRLNIRKQYQVLTNANVALTEQKTKLVAERNDLREQLKTVASKLGVSETAGHCVQRIGELAQELQTTADKLGVVEGDRDTMQETRDSYKRSRDCFKAKYEGCVSDLSVVKAKLLAYQGQGFWGRLLGRVPY